MKNKFPTFFLLFLLNGSAYCYEVETHRKISEEAAQVSNLSLRLPDLGLDNLDSTLPKNTAVGSAPVSAQVLYCNEGINSTSRLSILNLIKLGAFCEDTTFGTKETARYLHHFYDPAHFGRGFQGGSFSSSLVWGLETTDIPTQEFSYKDARNYFYKGLTFPAKIDREKNLAQTFRSIGQVIHLVQDLAQPQHTRDDVHGIPPSLYEGYTDINSVRNNLPFGGYSLVQITNPKQLWDTDDLKGLANFSNMNFVSAGTNFDKPGLFQYPQFDVAKRTKMNIQDLCANRVPACPNPSLSGVITFYGNDVTDRNTGQTTRNPYASSDSIFSADLTKRGMNPAFTLNRFNFELAHTFLIPRAVGYSAGLINYFFRGKLDFIADPDNPGKYLIKNLGLEEMKGTFALYYDDKDGKRYPVADGTWKDLTIPALNNPQGLPNKSSALTFTPPTDPAPNASGEYMLVFNGDMGEEKAGSGSVGAVVAKKIEANGSLLAIGKIYGSGPHRAYLSNDFGESWSRQEGSFDSQGVGAQITYIGNNAVLAPQALSVDGGKNWSSLSTAEWPTVQKRVTAARGGDNRLIGFDISIATNPAEINMAFSSDNGVTWTADQKASGLFINASRPVYMGNNRFIMQSFYLIGKIPCSWALDTLCDSYGAALLSSADGGSTWSKLADQALLGLTNLIYLGKNKLVNGVLTPDAQGTDTLFALRYVRPAPRVYQPQFVRSIDGGVTWETTGFPAEMAAYAAPEWNDMWYMAYVGNSTLLAYFHNGNSPARHYLYKSTDNGATWALTGNLPAELIDPGFYGMVFAGNPKTIPGFR